MVTVSGGRLGADPLRRVAAPVRRQVAERLREAIANGEFEPGARLVEKALVGRYGVSRTVVREALRQLEAEGLVDLVANRGPVVRVLSDAEADALYEVRGALEGLAGQLFARRATPEQRADLRRVLAEIRNTVDAGGDLTQLLKDKDAFYDTLIAGSGNEVVERTLRGLHTQIRMLRGLSMQADGRLPDTLRELEGIVEAAADRPDPDAARLRCAEHVAAAARAMRRARAERRGSAGA